MARKLASELLGRGATVNEVAGALHVSRVTVWRWRQDPEFAHAVEEGRLYELSRLKTELYKQAFHDDILNPVKHRAIMELLKSMEPELYDPSFRRREHEAELSHLYNTRVQFQRYMDERDARIQEENAQRAMEDQAEAENPLEDLSLQAVLADLRNRRLTAGKEAAKEADDYVKPNGTGAARPPEDTE
ncbi:MAG: helix-turn-helix domain-containing protein [Geminicoccaceae bacterium]